MHADGLDDAFNLLIAATQDILRGNSQIKLGQKELAEKAGVSQVLVNHYFRDKAGMIIAATQPVVRNYANELHDILLEDAGAIERLHNAIALMIRMHRSDGNILENYAAFIDDIDHGQYQNLLDDINEELHQLIKECKTLNLVGETELNFTVTLLWGACKSLANFEMQHDQKEKNLIDEFSFDKILAHNLGNVMLSGLSACAFERSITSTRR